MDKHLTQLGLEFERFAAIDGACLSPALERLYDQNRALQVHGKALSPGEIGCALSHAAIYQRMQDEAAPVALILEDDVVLAEEAIHIISKSISSSFPWDIINLISDVDERLDPENKLTPEHWLSSFVENPNRTGAYLIRLTGAQKMLKNVYPIRMPADNMLGDFDTTDAVLRGIVPPIATLLPVKSTFQRGNYPPRSIVWKRKIPSEVDQSLFVLNPVLRPSQLWSAWHRIRSYLGPIKRWILGRAQRGRFE